MQQTEETAPTSGADCYSARERPMMTWSQNLRARLCRRLLKRLATWRVSPDHLTLLALLCGLAFCPIYFWNRPVALAALALHALFDGLDGPLARHLGVAGRRGSFTDTVSDQIVVVASTLTLMTAGTVNVFIGGAYAFLYTAVVTFAMVRNALAIPYSWLVRPRFVVYAWLIVESWLWTGSLDYVLAAAALLLAGKTISGFLRIRARI